MGVYCFGIDVGGTTIKCGLFTTEGTLVEKWEIPTRVENEGSNIIPDIAQTVLGKMHDLGLQTEEIEGIGLGLPGPVNEKGEVFVAVNLHWGFKAVASEMAALTGLKAYAGNDANVAALGESWKGAASGGSNVLLITLGTGVGGGIIVNGNIVAGVHGSGGEIGHAMVNRQETVSCNCGNKGCLEQYCSATGIVRMAREELAASQEPSSLRKALESQTLEAKTVVDAYKAGDPLATRVMERFGDILGSAVAVFCTVTDPEFVVIGGGVSKAGQPLIDLIRKYYVKYAFTSCRHTPIVLASMGNDAGIYGAARMVLRGK